MDESQPVAPLAADVSQTARLPVAIQAWAILRLPALLVVLYLLRHQIISLIERRYDIIHLTEFAIDVLSTLAARSIYIAALTAVLLACLATTRRLHPLAGYCVTVALGFVLVVLAHQLTSTPRRLALPVTLLLATNLLPVWVVHPIARRRRLWTAIMAAAAGVAEVLFFRHYVQWLWPRSARGRLSIAATIPGLLLAAGLSAAVLNGHALVSAEQAMRMSSQARILAGGDWNWIEIDATGRFLFVTGHGVPRLQRYNLTDWSAPPLQTADPTGGAQGFAYDPAAGEIYVYNTGTHELMYLDADTLQTKRGLSLPQVAPGDPWIATDSSSNTITIASEADFKTGVAFLVLDRTSGIVLDERDIDCGNILLHPSKPVLYLSFFRRLPEVMQYDLQRRDVTRSVPTDARAERMQLWVDANELLVTSPVQSRVLRYDADTLAPKGHIDGPFGGRAIAIDRTRNLLLCGSLATGKLETIDLSTGRRTASYYLGPWLRTIQVDASRGVAYVSSNGALYELNYAAAE